MASRESAIMSEERGELEDTPDGYHVGVAYISGTCVVLQCALLCRRPKPDRRAL